MIFFRASSSNYSPKASGSGGSRSGGENITSSPIKDILIKCFCGVCESFFKKSKIEYALKSTGYQILKDQESLEILKKFLIFLKGNSRIRLRAEDFVECYELASDIVHGIKGLEENRADLDDYLDNFYNDKLVNAIDDGTTDDVLYDIMEECSKNLENTREYALFKEELIKKLN